MRASDESGSDDADAVRRVLAGDVEAFGAIVERWQGPLVNLAYRFCRDHGHAEDMAQEAFVKAYAALASWRGESRFSTWLFALALNLYRSRARRYEPAFVPVDEATAADAPRALDVLEARERDERVRRAVLALPDKYRDALIAYYFHDLDVVDAAATLRVPTGTLKARLARGRDLLRSKLERVRAEER